MTLATDLANVIKAASGGLILTAYDVALLRRARDQLELAELDTARLDKLERMNADFGNRHSRICGWVLAVNGGYIGINTNAHSPQTLRTAIDQA